MALAYQELKVEIRQYRDQFNMITQADKDGGDTANRIGAMYACMAALGVDSDDEDVAVADGFRSTVAQLTAGLPDGRYRRHPAPGRWYNNPDNVTRDQMITLEAAMVLTNSVEMAKAHSWLRFKRVFFHFSSQNDGQDAGPLVTKFPDAPSPAELGLLIRATKSWLIYPTLWLTDIFLLIDVAYGRSANERSLYDSDNQMLPTVLASISRYPTIWTPLIKWVYSRTDAAARLRLYYQEGPGYNGIAPLGELMAQTFEAKIK